MAGKLKPEKPPKAVKTPKPPKPKKLPEAPTVNAPDHLTMNIFAPGMSALHRAGLGGLACTLMAMERHHKNGLLRTDKLPGPLVGTEYPWEIRADFITLRFGSPDRAGDYLKKLFAFAFQIREGVIYLPGQYSDPPPSVSVRAAIQEGLQNTFLQHGPTCGSRNGSRVTTIAIDDTEFTFEHDVFTSYKHQGWFWLDRDEKSKDKDPVTGKKIKTGLRIKNHQSLSAVVESGCLSGIMHDIDNKIIPGAMVRHDRFDRSAFQVDDAGLICLHFSLVGCLALCTNRVTAVLLIPDVSDLRVFSEQRKWITPRNYLECKVANAADVALQTQIRVRANQLSFDMDLPLCHTVTCQPTKWNEKQKPRVNATLIPVESNQILDRYERAMANLPPRLIVPVEEANSKKKRGVKEKKPQSYWIDSTVRPLVATNLALNRYWYSDFHLLFKDKQTSKTTDYETRGLKVMGQDKVLNDADEAAFVKAIHRAIYMGRGRIYAETMGQDAARANKPANLTTKKRWEKFMERFRLGLVGSKTDSQVHTVINVLLARNGVVHELRDQDAMTLIRQFIFGTDWQRVKNLALFAAASYVRPPKVNSIAGDPEDEDLTTTTHSKE